MYSKFQQLLKTKSQNTKTIFFFFNFQVFADFIKQVRTRTRVFTILGPDLYSQQGYQLKLFSIIGKLFYLISVVVEEEGEQNSCPARGIPNMDGPSLHAHKKTQENRTIQNQYVCTPLAQTQTNFLIYSEVADSNLYFR